MKTCRTIRATREVLRALPGATVGLVPTMGALHDGHLSLLRAARTECDIVVMSLFVNPTQFGDSVDLDGYPRDEARDLALAGEEGVDVVFAPSAAEMYPPGFQTWVDVTEVGSMLEGTFRPGYFRGVATVCLKLFSIVRPDRAYFGQKDAQQVEVIRRLIRDLALGDRPPGPPHRARPGRARALVPQRAPLARGARSRACATPRSGNSRSRQGPRTPQRAGPRRRLRRGRTVRPTGARRRSPRRRAPA